MEEEPLTAEPVEPPPAEPPPEPPPKLLADTGTEGRLKNFVLYTSKLESDLARLLGMVGSSKAPTHRLYEELLKMRQELAEVIDRDADMA